MSRDEFYAWLNKYYDLWDTYKALEIQIKGRQTFIQRAIDDGLGDVIFEVIRDRQADGRNLLQDN